jgi:hypothetical protein
MEPHLAAARVHRILAGIGATASGGLALLIVVLAIANGDASLLLSLFMPVIILVGPAIHFFVAREAEKGDGSGKTASTVLGVLMLFGFPIGTFVGVYLLHLCSQNWNVPTRKRLSTSELAAAFPGAAVMPAPAVEGGDRPA